jgi:hypothetical protein
MQDPLDYFWKFHKNDNFKITVSDRYGITTYDFFAEFGTWDNYCRKKDLTQEVQDRVKEWLKTDKAATWNDTSKEYEKITPTDEFKVVLDFYRDTFKNQLESSYADIRSNNETANGNETNASFIEDFITNVLFKDQQLQVSALPYWLSLLEVAYKLIAHILIYPLDNGKTSYLENTAKKIADLLGAYDMTVNPLPNYGRASQILQENEGYEGFNVTLKQGKNCADFLSKLQESGFIHKDTTVESFRKVICSGQPTTAKIIWAHEASNKFIISKSAISFIHKMVIPKTPLDKLTETNPQLKKISFFFLKPDNQPLPVNSSIIGGYKKSKLEYQELQQIIKEFVSPQK